MCDSLNEVRNYPLENNGLIVADSAQDVTATAARFIDAAKRAGLTIFGQRDNTKGGEDPNRPRPSILVLFANPNIMARLTGVNPEIGIDLPMKVLIWETVDGKTKICYNDPQWLFRRHRMPQQLSDVADKIAATLNDLVKAAGTSSTQH